ncbi:MAG: hypothetical protein WEA09_08285 [Gemmatimonadota bacterium]
MAAEDTTWNSPRVLALLEQGRATRSRFRAQGELESYTALSEGHIYFYMDPETGEDPLLIRADQVAVQLYWKAPNLTRQVIVGLREERRLPVRDFRYYLDRLTVVQNGFGDLVQVGGGLDVAGAPHPLAVMPVVVGGEILDARQVYDARLRDSVAVQLPGRPEPVTIYEVEVRPRSPGVPALVGSIFLDRETGAVVRMDFTFTPAAYTDPRTDQIHISLDHGLWDGEYWLPREQRIRVRREVPELDLGVGTVIQAVMRVSGYELNPPLEDGLFQGSPVVTVPEVQRQHYPFREGLLERIAEEGLEGSLRRVELAELQARTRQMILDARNSGLPPFRFHLPGASSLVSYRRSRGLGLGAGVSWTPSVGVSARAVGGYHLASGQPHLRLGVERPAPGGDGLGRLRVEGWWGQESDLGLAQGSPELVNTLSALALGRDDTDPFGSHGLAAHVKGDGSGWGGEAGGRAEWIRSATREVELSPWADDPFREVRPVHDGLELSIPLALTWTGSPAARRTRNVRLTLQPGLWRAHGLEPPRSETTLRTRLKLRESWTASTYDTQAHLSLSLWRAWGALPPHHAVLLGGRGTVDGWSYRTLGSHGGGSITGEVSRDIHPVWMRLHGRVQGAWVEAPDPSLAQAWDIRPDGGYALSVSVGMGVFYDILRVGVARGVGGGRWSVFLRPDQAWWSWL